MWELPPGEGWQVEPQFIGTHLEDEEKHLVCQPLPAHVVVTKACQVGEVSAAIRRASWVALDTESNQQFVYMPRVCLLQINAQNSLFILDTIALYQEDPSGSCLESLWRALRHPHSIFVHGGDNDVSCLKRDFNVSLTRNIFIYLTPLPLLHTPPLCFFPGEHTRHALRRLTNSAFSVTTGLFDTHQAAKLLSNHSFPQSRGSH